MESRQELIDLIQSIYDRLSNNEFAGISDSLIALEMDELHPTQVIAWLRTTFTARTLIPSWHNAVARAKSSLDERGYDGAILLKGLF